MVVILFTTEFPSPFTDALEAQEVHEALAISEVLALTEQHPISSIIVTPDVDQARAKVSAQHYPNGALSLQQSSLSRSFLPRYNKSKIKAP
jgi:hypothetical protein